MSCPEEYELFTSREGGAHQDETEGEKNLSEERAGEIAKHLASCPSCQAKVAELDALGQALAHPEALTEGERSAFLTELVQKIDEQEERPTTPGPSRFWSIGVPIAAAACCGLAAIVVIPFFFVLGSSQEASLAMAPAMSMESFDQVSEGDMEPASRSLDSVSGTVSGSYDHRQASATPAQNALPQPAAAPRPTLEESGQHPAQPRRSKARSSKRRRSSATPAPTGASNPQDEAEASRFAEGSPSTPAPEAASAFGAKGLNSEAMLGMASGGMSGSGRSSAQPAAARPSSIDPNGRFATTYRPGRGHLAQFEKSLLRGQLPEPALQLVADEGRGHGPIVAAPTERALALDVRTGMAQLPPSGGPIHLALTLRSTERQPLSRPDVAVHLVVDTSGSMSGQPIEQARQAARTLVGLLQPNDRFSLVSYSSGAQVVVTEGVVGPRRQQILGQIMSLRAQGGTNLEAGLREGYEQATQSRSSRDAVQLVIVLSDGRPNQGVTDPWVLSEKSAAAFQAGVETTTIGVGNNYEPLVLNTIAEYGAGGYYYLPDASTIEQVLRAELDVRCQPVARGVELRLRLGDGVELLQAYGSRRLNEMEAQRVRQTEVAIDQQSAQRDGINQDRQEDREGGMRFFIPGFARDDEHTILLRLRAPAGAGGGGGGNSSPLTLADLELRYKDRVLGSNQGDERQIRLSYAANDQLAQAALDVDVRRTVLSFRTGEALVAISSQMSRGQGHDALALLYERVALLRSAAQELNDATLRADAERLESFRTALAGRQTGNDLRTGSLLSRAGTGLMR